MDLHPSYPTGDNSLWKYDQGCEYWVKEMAATAATVQDLYSQMAIGNQIYQAAKVVIRVVISKEDLCRELVMSC